MAKEIDLDLVRKLFEYNKESGKLLLRQSRGVGGRFKKGDEVGSRHICGSKKSHKVYLRTRLGKDSIYVHRIIWVLVTGEQPKEIDHINGNGLDNRWCNLRSVTHSSNGKNQMLHNTNTSGHTGVGYRKEANKWRARIMVDGKNICLGDFISKDKAIEVRKAAEIKYWGA